MSLKVQSFQSGTRSEGLENIGLESGTLVNPSYIPHFLDLTEDFADEAVPLLDRDDAVLYNLTDDQIHWHNFGYVIKRNFVPHDLIDEYLSIRERENLGAGAFPNTTPYLYHSAIRDICCSRELHYLMVDLLGEELGLHFLLSSFQSTQRGWHQDDYLNPEDVMGRYAAVWIAMGDVHPDSGPFEFVPGSHRWPCLRREKVRTLVVPEIRANTDLWTVHAEYFVNKAVENYIEETGSEIAFFDAKKGDILIWHAKLIHRGSIPKDPSLTRPALIAHYSNIRDRRDIGDHIVRHGDGGYFWQFPERGKPLREDKFERMHATPAATNLPAATAREVPHRITALRKPPSASRVPSAARMQNLLEARVSELEAEIRNLRASTSWRATAPARAVAGWLRGRT